MSKLSHNPFTQRGFSLVELMIALTLGLLITAAVGALFYSNKRSFNQNTLIAELQDNARFSLEAVSRDLEMANFMGGMPVTKIPPNPTFENVPALTLDCDPGPGGGSEWAYSFPEIEFIDNVVPANINATYGCLNANNVVANTDILGVRRTSGQLTASIDAPGAAHTLTQNVFYLRTNGTKGSVFFSGTSTTNPPGGDLTTDGDSPISFWEYYSRLYFVSPSTLNEATGASTNDGIPTLYRAFLSNQAAPTVRFEALAQGVENMQIAFGIDTSPTDGVVNQYVAPSTPEDIKNMIPNALTARIQLLVRSVNSDFSYNNRKSYNFFGQDDDDDGQIDEFSETPPQVDGPPVDDNFYRRLVYTTVILQN